MFTGVFEQSNCWRHFWCHFFEVFADTTMLGQRISFDIGADRMPSFDL
jgi:hypothetical protein